MIICCGEALIDMLPRELDDGTGVFYPASGGAVFNTAIALGRLGADTGFVSGISTDMFGEQLVSSLNSSGVTEEFLVRSEQPTTLAFVKLVDGQARYSFFDENSAGRMLDVNDLPELPNNTRALHFGAISLIPEPCGSAYEALMSRYARQAVISLDPNIRPGFIKDTQSHRSRINRMIAMSDIVKVSDEDLDWIAGAAKADEAIDTWLKAATSIVVLTRGSKGATLITKSERFDVPAVEAKVVDTVGAGDTFNAGFLFGLKQAGILTKTALEAADRSQLEEAAGLAARVAALTVSKAGANPPWKDEIDSL